MKLLPPLLCAALCTPLLLISCTTRTYQQQETSPSTSTGTTLYPMLTLDEVATHKDHRDCWIIIDKLVFDVSQIAMDHPGMFGCGGDSSTNYHRNHGPKIRDKMLVFQIGQLAPVTKNDNEENAKPTYTPSKELYVPSKSWDNKHLMVVIERGSGSILMIDDRTHTPVGRITSIGAQPHTQVFSSDTKYMYTISRDGYLSKVDLDTFDTVSFSKVGVSSRGTALTANDKILAIGNYDPTNVVLIDTKSMEVIQSIDLVDTQNQEGEIKKSRAGAIVESGNAIVVALKDARSVWVIDTETRGFPIQKFFWDVGMGLLHDGFLSPDGNYFIVAAQNANEVWVFDMNTLEQVAKIPSGKTPHTGPGAYHGDYYFIPSLGENTIAVINKTDWSQEKLIEINGPSMFVRHYSKDSTYPYIWGDAIAEEGIDEIYVIDGKSLEIVETIVSMEGEKSLHPEFSYDGSAVYIPVWTGNRVFVYNANTFEYITDFFANGPVSAASVGLRVEEVGL